MFEEISMYVYMYASMHVCVCVCVSVVDIRMPKQNIHQRFVWQGLGTYSN